MGKRCSSTVMPGCTEPPECSEAAGHRTAAGKERERERDYSGPERAWECLKFGGQQPGGIFSSVE